MAGRERRAGSAGGDERARASAESAAATRGGEGERTGNAGAVSGGAARTATVNLPFMTAVFHAPEVRMPEMHMPNRDDLNAAARRVGGFVPSGKAALYYGGLAAVAVAGVIEWPVAAAIGVGTALASRGQARPEPRGQEEAASD